MIGAIIGDIVGSRFEKRNPKTKDFELFTELSTYTDDSVMSLAVCEALLKSENNRGRLDAYAVGSMRRFGKQFWSCGFGHMFKQWLKSPDHQPYGSYGNGSAMRVSGCAYAANTLEEVIKLSKTVTEVTHNHPEGIKGAEAVAVCVYLARTGATKGEIREHVLRHYYNIDFTLDEIRPSYKIDLSCQGSVPQALEAFFESEDFEDAIRNAVSIGGDSDTIAAMTGSIAEAYYGVPVELREKTTEFLDKELIDILQAFEAKYPPKILSNSDQ